MSIDGCETIATNQSIIIGNALDKLKDMPEESVDLCITSPPYYNLRSYENPNVWWMSRGGGDKVVCEHEITVGCGIKYNSPQSDHNGGHGCTEAHRANCAKDIHLGCYCAKCGAWKGQLGNEPHFDLYIEHLCQIFDEVKRVLKPSGSCWVNLGDTYNGDKKGHPDNKSTEKTRISQDNVHKNKVDGLRSKSLLLIPARFAIAMTERGWILRNDIILSKINTMPESVKDRFTKSHEHFLFFVKNETYYFKQQKETCRESSKLKAKSAPPEGRNKRDVWEVKVSQSEYEHVAIFNPAWLEIPIDACCPPNGTILDPFAGSGTTLEVARKKDLNAIGIEINPSFKSMIEKRAMKNIKQLEEWYNDMQIL